MRLPSMPELKVFLRPRGLFSQVQISQLILSEALISIDLDNWIYRQPEKESWGP